MVVASLTIGLEIAIHPDFRPTLDTAQQGETEFVAVDGFPDDLATLGLL